MIFCSVLLDTMLFWSCYILIQSGPVSRYPTAFTWFYGVRFFCQCIFSLPYPEGYNWGYPGIPSITIKYGQTADFFFSGHIGLSTICLMEFWACGYYKVVVFAMFAMTCNACMLIILRAHYSIDLIGGFVFGHYIWIMADKYDFMWTPDWWFDNWKWWLDGCNDVIN
jgi:hypothetical protein